MSADETIHIGNWCFYIVYLGGKWLLFEEDLLENIQYRRNCLSKEDAIWQAERIAGKKYEEYPVLYF